MTRALAAVVLAALVLGGIAACVRHVELRPDAAPPDAHHDSGGPNDVLVRDGVLPDAFTQD